MSVWSLSTNVSVLLLVVLGSSIGSYRNDVANTAYTVTNRTTGSRWCKQSQSTGLCYLATRMLAKKTMVGLRRNTPGHDCDVYTSYPGFLCSRRVQYDENLKFNLRGFALLRVRRTMVKDKAMSASGVIKNRLRIANLEP